MLGYEAGEMVGQNMHHLVHHTRPSFSVTSSQKSGVRGISVVIVKRVLLRRRLALRGRGFPPEFVFPREDAFSSAFGPRDM
jgi:hypothetical protein